MIKLKTFLVLLIFNMVFLNNVFADYAKLKNMIVFGDSLSDIGNNTWILLDGIVGTPITNPNKQNEKYLWFNYLVHEKLNSIPYPSRKPHLNPLSDNISYAYATADTSHDYLNTDWPQIDTPLPSINPDCTKPGPIKDANGQILSTCVPGLLLQVDSYLTAVHHKPGAETLFFIWSGANDLLNYYTAYMKHSLLEKIFIERFSLPTKEQLDPIEQLAVDHINAAIDKLIKAGVKPEMIYVLDMPDLSRTPSIRANKSWALKILYGKKNVENSLRNMALGFNQKLQSSKSKLLDSHYIQIGNLLDHLISNPAQYDLNNIDESCIANNQMPACHGFLFYNSKHPTTYVNQIIAETLLPILNKQLT